MLCTRSLRLKNAELGHQRLKNAELDCRQNASETVLPSKKVRFRMVERALHVDVNVGVSVILGRGWLQAGACHAMPLLGKTWASG